MTKYYEKLVQKYGANDAYFYEYFTAEEKMTYTHAVRERGGHYSPREYFWDLQFRKNFVSLKELGEIFGDYAFVDRTIRKFKRLMRKSMTEEDARKWIEFLTEVS